MTFKKVERIYEGNHPNPSRWYYILDCSSPNHIFHYRGGAIENEFKNCKIVAIHIHDTANKIS